MGEEKETKELPREYEWMVLDQISPHIISLTERFTKQLYFLIR